MNNNTKIIHEVMIMNVPFITFILAGFLCSIEDQIFNIETQDTEYSESTIEEYKIQWQSEHINLFKSHSRYAQVLFRKNDNPSLRYSIWLKKINGDCHWIYINKIKTNNKDIAKYLEVFEIKITDTLNFYKNNIV